MLQSKNARVLSFARSHDISAAGRCLYAFMCQVPSTVDFLNICTPRNVSYGVSIYKGCRCLYPYQSYQTFLPVVLNTESILVLESA